MADQDVIPPEGEITHLLWILHFLKAYPRQSAVCSTVGGSTGAIDPKINTDFSSFRVPSSLRNRVRWLWYVFYVCLRPVLSQQKMGNTIFRYDFVAGGQIVPKQCLCDRIEKDGWDGRPRVASHLFTGSLAGIGKLPALAGRYIRFGIFVL
jgi:hypothetical protein